MTRLPYSKLPKTFEEQLLILEQRGLIVENHEKALKILSTINYYRFYQYLYPLLDLTKRDTFKIGATFNEAFTLYKFDSEIRLLIFYAIEQIEVGFKTQMAYHVSHHFTNGNWLCDKNCFKDFSLFIKENAKILNVLQRNKLSKEPSLTNYYAKYQNNIPPAWITLEYITFRSASILYKNLLDSDLKNKISRFLNLKYDVLESWLETLVVTRNLCAHHMRLYNKPLVKKPKWTSLSNNWVNTWVRIDTTRKQQIPKVYAILCILKYCLNHINPHNSFKEKFLDIKNKYTNIDVELLLGFSDNWQEQQLWNT